MKKIKLYNGLQSLLIFIMLFCLSLLYKVDNFPGIRPLYTVGLIIFFILTCFEFYYFSYIKKVVISWFSLGPLIMLLLLLDIFFVSLLSGERALKDSLYLSFYLLLLPSLFLSRVYRGNLETILKAVIFFSVFSALIAILVLFNFIEYSKGDYKLIQNYWTAFRLHGFMGQPTAFGGLIGMSIILLSYLSNLNKKSYTLVWIILLIALIGSGSRNAIFSLSIAYLFIGFITLRFKLNLKLIIFSIIAIYAFVYFELYVYFADRSFNFQSEDNRVFIWGRVINLIFDNSNDLRAFVFGNGANELSRVYRAAFNTPLHIFYDYGLFGFITYLTSFVLSLYIGCKRFFLSKLIFYKYGLMLLIYGFVFNLFISSFLSPFFSFQVFSFIFGMLILATPIKWIREIK